MKIKNEDIVARECRFAIHLPERHGVRPDLHLIKEIVHLKDGSTQPQVRLARDYKRKFWLTAPSFRNHKDKKEWEHVDKLVEYECTQSQLRDRVAAALELAYTSDHLKKLSVSPYLYGTDMTSTSLIKKQYMEKYPEHRTPYNIGYLDIETRPGKDGSNKIVLITVLFKDKLFTAAIKSMVSGIADLDRALETAMNTYLPQYKDKLDDTLGVYDTEIDLIKAAFAKLHSWSPDFLAIWNMDFDIQRILETIHKSHLDPKDVLSDPNIPEYARYCKYIQGKTKKVTASGKVTPISPASRWHTFLLTAGFYVMDAMCVYKLLRIQDGEKPSYSLDAILKDELKTQKLKFDKADHLIGIPWHLYMQDNYPVEYIVYNRYDVLSMQELEAKTKDLAFKVPEFAGCTDFDKFNSQPKKIADAMYGYLEKQGYILGTVGYEDNKPFVFEEDDSGLNDDEEEESSVLSLAGWILTLQADMQCHGLKLLVDAPDIQTNIRGMVYDSDAVSAYPTATSVQNISKETTEREIISIEGIPEDVFRMQNINLMSGPINSVEYCINMLNAPKLQTLHSMYVKQKGINNDLSA